MVPNVDWCKVERAIPKITRGIVMLRINLRGAFHPNASKTMGLNSNNNTVVYAITHQPISKSG